jgi:hypothetical protein
MGFIMKGLNSRRHDKTFSAKFQLFQRFQMFQPVEQSVALEPSEQLEPRVVDFVGV